MYYQNEQTKYDITQYSKYFNECLEYAKNRELNVIMYQMNVGVTNNTIFESNSMKYHKFGCSFLDLNNTYYIYPTKTLQNRNIDECYFCKGVYNKVKLSKDFKENAKNYTDIDYSLLIK